MKVQTTITLSEDEVLKALTRFLQEKTRYGRDVPHPGYGDVLSVSECDDGWRVQWGEKPEPKTENPPVPQQTIVKMAQAMARGCTKDMEAAV